MTNLIQTPEYKKWLNELKNRLLTGQIKAAVTVNKELLRFYWQLGEDITRKQDESHWGDGLIKHLSHDLMAEFPEMKGFSLTNLKYIRRWYLFYCDHLAIGQQAVDQLPDFKKTELIQQITTIPWGHNIAIIVKCKTTPESLFYVDQTLAHS